MQPILQSLLSRLANDKFLDGLQLVRTACLKSTRVMESVSIVVRESDFIVDIMKATLSTDRHDQLSAKEYVDPTSIVGSSSTWMDDDGIESAIENEHIPDGECLMDRTCK